MTYLERSVPSFLTHFYFLIHSSTARLPPHTSLLGLSPRSRRTPLVTYYLY